MATHTFIVNGKQVSVDCADDVRLLSGGEVVCLLS